MWLKLGQPRSGGVTSLFAQAQIAHTIACIWYQAAAADNRRVRDAAVGCSPPMLRAIGHRGSPVQTAIVCSDIPIRRAVCRSCDDSLAPVIR